MVTTPFLGVVELEQPREQLRRPSPRRSPDGMAAFAIDVPEDAGAGPVDDRPMPICWAAAPSFSASGPAGSPGMQMPGKIVPFTVSAEHRHAGRRELLRPWSAASLSCRCRVAPATSPWRWRGKSKQGCGRRVIRPTAAEEDAVGQ